ncbi:hypothetical protein [Chlamydia ibidis]|uniref:hypothetical protein n=1 Tax=Chlamydia ibidis TaxID=1405396 RepID=UPI0005520ACB|nr:hypothetical protein [Chlamydia ibidis]
MITLSQRFQPYVLSPGALIPIPGSLLYAQIFPTLYRVFSSSRELLYEEGFSAQGPLKRFAVFQDLHRGGLIVTSEKYTYYILPTGEKVVTRKGYLPVSTTGPFLSLGVHKHMDLQKIRHRRDLKEILPLWFRMAHLMATHAREEHLDSVGTGELLVVAHEKIKEKKKTELCDDLLAFYLSAFSYTFLPRWYDSEYQGIIDGLPEDSSIAFPLLQYSLPVIHDIFVNQGEECVEILPSLPPEFPCGRFVNFNLPGIGKLSIEWTKKMIRRMSLYAETTRTIRFSFASSLLQSRLRVWEHKSLCDSRIIPLGETIEIKVGTTYLWDCFYK